MNSDEQKNIIKTKDIHFNEQVFQQLVNGFQNAKKAQQEFDMTYMKTYPSVRQQIRMRITAPHLFGSFLSSNFLRGVIHNQYQGEKKKRMKILRDNFFTSWYDLQWWSKKLNQDQQQFDAEKDKSSWFGKLFKAYRIFTNFGRVYQTFKSMYKAAKNSQGFRSLFGRSYNLYNEQDYRAFQTNLNKALTDSVGVVQAGLITWFKPTVLSIRGLYLKQLQKLYDKFAWWLFKEIFWGNNWVDIVFSIAGYAISIIGSIWTFGGSSAIAAGQWAYRIGKVSLLMKRVFGIFSKTKTAVRFANKGKNVHKMTAIGRWGRRAEAWGKRTMRSSGVAKAMKRLDKAREKLKYAKLIKRIVSGPLKFYIMLGKFTDYQAVRGYIHTRTRLMYQGMRGWLTKWEYATDAVGDIIGGMKLLSNAGRQRYLSQRYHDNRVNKKFGLQMKMSNKEVKKYPFFTTLEKLQIFFNKLQKNGLGKIKFGDIFGLNSQWKRGGSMALIMSNLTGKKGDIISWHRGGKQLLLQFSDKQKISIVLDKDGKVDIVQVGEKAIYWQKAISNTQSQLAGRKSNAKVSGFQWMYTNTKRRESNKQMISQYNTILNIIMKSKRGSEEQEAAVKKGNEIQAKLDKMRKQFDYFRGMKMALGAKITLDGVDFGPNRKTIKPVVSEGKYKGQVAAQVHAENNFILVQPNQIFLLGQSFSKNYESFIAYGRRQVEAQQKLKKQCQLLLQIIIDKSSNDEGRQYNIEESEKLMNEIIDNLDIVVNVFAREDEPLLLTNDWEKFQLDERTRNYLIRLRESGRIDKVRRIYERINAKLKKNEKTGRVVAIGKANKDGQILSYGITNQELNQIISQEQGRNPDYIDDKGNYHSE